MSDEEDIHTEDQSSEKPEGSSGETRRLTDEEFEAARTLYELGKASIAKLADDYGVSRQALSRRLANAGAVKGAKAAQASSAASAAAIATTERFAEKRAEMIEETRMQGVSILKNIRILGQKMVMDQVRRSSSGGGQVKLDQIDDDLKALGRYNKIIVDNLTTALGIMRADEHIDEEDLPVLTIEDLTDQDILNHHISTGALEEDATIEDLNLYDVTGSKT